MDNLIEEVTSLQGELQHFIELFGIPLEDFEDAGLNGFLELYDQGVPRDDSIFANSLSNRIEFVPLEVVRSICLAAAFILAGLSSHQNGEPNATNFLMRAAEEVGFIRGVVYGAVHTESNNARYAAFARHAADPKQADKAIVRECWNTWQKNPDDYASKSAFALDMLRQFPRLMSQRVITDKWCPAWEKENLTLPAK